MSSTLRRIAGSLAAGMALGAPFVSAAQNYVIEDLGVPRDSYSEAHGINVSGSVVGEYEYTNSVSVGAFLYENATRTELPFLGGTPYAVAYGINDTNLIVGESDAANNTRAFKYENGVMTDLGTLGSFSGYSSAHAVNRSGQIVGVASLQVISTLHAALYSGSTKTDLGALGGNYSSASAINNSGVIVGESDIVEQGVTNVHAFIYTNNAMKDLGTLGGAYSSARGINDSGVIVGEAETLISGVSYLHAFVYRNGAMSDLGTFGGAASSASAINGSGQIVGYATDANEVSRAFLLNGTTMVDLNDHIPAGSVWTNLSSADAINDAGQIAGSGFQADGSYHAYLLSPAAPLSVRITNPAPNATFQAPATFEVSATVSDTGGTVTNVEFLVNGAVIGNAVSAPYGATANNLAAGTYILVAVAADNVGLKATNSINVTVTSADVPPTVALTSPTPSATFLAPATFAIDASASDTDGTVTNVEFLVNGTVMGNATSAPYSATAANLPAGSYTLTAVAADNAGLKATNSITVAVLDAPPAIAITNPAPNATFLAPATFAVTASASDPDGTVTNVEFLVNSTVIGNVTSAPYSATAASLPAGSYTLAAVAADNAGLKATNSISVTVTSSTTLPVTLINPAYSGTSYSFSFATQSGHTYAGQFLSPLSSTGSWLTFTNLAGDGSVVRVTDSTSTNGERYYRVVAQ